MSPVVLLDVRCLQDPDYARRGVGRHALALLRGARASRPALRLQGLVDSELPPLIEEACGELEAVHVNAYAAGGAGSSAQPPSVFVSLSPMTHDPLFAARLLVDPALLRVAVVYDFIPNRYRDRYLPTAAAQLGYATQLRWLARCSLFTPISRSAADDMRTLMGVPEHRIAVTGAPIDPGFETIPELKASRDAKRGRRGLRPRHLLVVGGGDPRKNPEAVIRAHAGSRSLQAQGLPLVIAGNYAAETAQMFRDIAATLGARPELVEVPGHITEDALHRLYAQALLVVCPSRDEGFSLPVVESMAAGVPTLGSDIPAHRELLEDAGQRFPLDDDAALTGLLEAMLADEERCRAALTRQAEMWPRFRAEAVASRFWDAIQTRLEASAGVPDARPRPSPAIIRGAKAKVAILSPMPPDRSGCADYTAATCSELGRLVDLHVFTDTASPTRPDNVASIRPLSALAHVLPQFDRVVSVVGNSHFHTAIFHMLLRYGGACIAHDARMLGFYAGLLGMKRACAAAAAELGRRVDEAEMRGWLSDENTAEALLLGDLARVSAPMVVHSAATARMMQERHAVTAPCLPFSIYRPIAEDMFNPQARAAARARLNLADGELVIATFGYVHDTKCPQDCVWALERLRAWGLPARLHFVGSVAMEDGGAELKRLIGKLGLWDSVRLSEHYFSEQTYGDYLLGADLAVQLRTFDLGGLSGALLDCVAAGLPTVTNNALGAAVGVAVDYVRRIPDAISPVLIAEALADLVANRMPAALHAVERRRFVVGRSMARYAEGLCEVLGLDAVALPAMAAR